MGRTLTSQQQVATQTVVYTHNRLVIATTDHEFVLAQNVQTWEREALGLTCCSKKSVETKASATSQILPEIEISKTGILYAVLRFTMMFI